MDVREPTHRLRPQSPASLSAPRSYALRAVRVVAWIGASALGGYVMAGRPQLALGFVALALGVGAAIRFPAVAVSGVLLLGAFSGSLRAFTEDEFPARNLTQLLIVAVVIAAIVSHLLAGQRRGPFVVPGVALLAAFLAITVAQIPFAETPLVGAQAFRAAGLPILLVFAVGYAAWDLDSRATLAKGVAVVALLVGAYAVLRLVIGPSEAERELASASAYNLLDEKLALVGSFASRQELSSWTAVAIPFCFALAIVTAGRNRMVPLVAMASCLVALLGSETRTALVAAVVGVLLVVALSLVSRATPFRRLGRTAAILTGLALVGGVGFALILGGSERAVQRYSSIVTPGEDRSFEVRREKWQATIEEIEEHPLGLGLGSAGTTQENYGRFVQLSAFEIDNTYLEIAYQQGVAPLLLFVATLLALLYSACRGALDQVSRLKATIAAGTAGALAAWIVLLTTLSQLEHSGTALMWTLLGLAVAQSIRQEPAPTPQRASNSLEAWPGTKAVQENPTRRLSRRVSRHTAQ